MKTDRQALEAATASLEAIAGLIALYPRPSLDPNGRLLLDAREHAKAAANKARWHLKQTRLGQSIECPHCHWGFSPHVIDQHIREKH